MLQYSNSVIIENELIVNFYKILLTQLQNYMKNNKQF